MVYYHPEANSKLKELLSTDSTVYMLLPGSVGWQRVNICGYNEYGHVVVVNQNGEEDLLIPQLFLDLPYILA